MRLLINCLTFILLALPFCTLAQEADSTTIAHADSVLIDSVKPGTLTVNQDYRINELQEKHRRITEKNPSLSGYRIQIYNGNSEESKKMKGKFIALHPKTPVYRVYETPEYKVQVGDFRTRLEAERFSHALREQFPGLLILKTMIMPPPLPEIVKKTEEVQEEESTTEE